MDNNVNKKKQNSIVSFIMTAISFIVVPKIISAVSDELYKKRKKDIDYDENQDSYLYFNKKELNKHEQL